MSTSVLHEHIILDFQPLDENVFKINIILIAYLSFGLFFTIPWRFAIKKLNEPCVKQVLNLLNRLALL